MNLEKKIANTLKKYSPYIYITEQNTYYGATSYTVQVLDLNELLIQEIFYEYTDYGEVERKRTSNQSLYDRYNEIDEESYDCFNKRISYDMGMNSYYKKNVTFFHRITGFNYCLMEYIINKYILGYSNARDILTKSSERYVTYESYLIRVKNSTNVYNMHTRCSSNGNLMLLEGNSNIEYDYKKVIDYKTFVTNIIGKHLYYMDRKLWKPLYKAYMGKANPYIEKLRKEKVNNFFKDIS